MGRKPRNQPKVTGDDNVVQAGGKPTAVSGKKIRILVEAGHDHNLDTGTVVVVDSGGDGSSLLSERELARKVADAVVESAKWLQFDREVSVERLKIDGGIPVAARKDATAKVDAYVALHFWTGSNKARGVSGFARDAQSLTLANEIVQAVVIANGSQDAGVREASLHRLAPLACLDNCAKRAVMVELGCLSSSVEMSNFDVKRTAEAIVEAAVRACGACKLDVA